MAVVSRHSALLFLSVVVAMAIGLAVALASAAAPKPTLFTFLQLTDRGPGIDDDAAIWTIRSDGTGLRRLTVACTDCAGSPRFSPDGSLIAYEGIGRDYSGGLFVMRPDGSSKRRLCRCTFDGGEAWSPDGRQIAIGYSGITIFTLGVGARKVGGLSSHIAVDELDWSPDGRWFSFDDGGNRVWIVGSDGRHLRRLAEDAAAPRFTPDSRSVVFSAVRRTGLFAVPVGGGPVRRVLARPAYWANWSSAGTQLAYFGRFGIHIRDLTTGHERQVSIPKRACLGASSCIELDWQH
jgi:Tol biopolymer transport system component